MAVASIQHNYGSISQCIQPGLQTGDAQIIAQVIAGLAMLTSSLSARRARLISR